MIERLDATNVVDVARVATSIGYTAQVHFGSVCFPAVVLLASACGGESKHHDAPSTPAGAAGLSESGGAASTGGMSGMAGMDASGAGGASGRGAAGCAEPPSVVPDLPPFEPPPIGPFGTYQVTFQNHCAETVWPAWGSAGGLDNSVIATELWLPLSPASGRSVVVYGGVRELGFWGRTRCSFDQAGNGTCQTGDCGGFVCPVNVNVFPASASVFVLNSGFLSGYNLPLRVEGATCGSHEYASSASACSDSFVVTNDCGAPIGCTNICGCSNSTCCTHPGSGCGQSDGHNPGADDLVMTFCP